MYYLSLWHANIISRANKFVNTIVHKKIATFAIFAILAFFLFLHTRYYLKKSSLSFHIGTFLQKSRLQPRAMWQSAYRINRQKNQKIATNLRFNTVTQRNRRNVRVFVTDFLYCEMQDTKRISFDTKHRFLWKRIVLSGALYISQTLIFVERYTSVYVSCTADAFR